MQAAVLVKNGSSKNAFEIQTLPDLPMCRSNEVKIEVKAFGLNFADVTARLGKYPDCPPLPAVIGYEVVGHVIETGSEVKDLKPGQRVLAFTRFGGYSTQVIAQANGVVAIPDNISHAEAAALATQYCTAYYAACIAINLQPSDRVLIQAAAGGVGIALTQIAKKNGCYIYGTAGSDSKLEVLRQLGVDVPVNYQKQEVAKIIAQTSPNGKLDVIFDSVGGSFVRKSFKMLNSGGRLVCYGAAGLSGANMFNTAVKALEFGFYHPIQFMMRSVSLIGVNMLRIADNKPELLQKALTKVVKGYQNGDFKPITGGVFPISELAKAHDLLQTRQTIGKVVVEW
ncbi:MAG: zinc-binding dehydrogenase [Sphingobacteriales bacterium]|nr:MAG: zinc-binding dehydrogenase [Sphingobacteriales bacterium]